MIAKVLIIDDEDLFREDLANLLRRQGHECETASSAEEGIVKLEAFGPDVVLCDIVMPERGGIDILDDISRISPESCVIMITAYGTMETAVEAFRKGAHDYIIKPLAIEDVLQKIRHCMDHKRLLHEVRYLRTQLSRDVESFSMVGQSESMKEVLDLITKVAPTRSTVLISGESGTGKELVAQTIHRMSRSKEQPFVAINCAGIPMHLLESELYGHVQGAFTGAVKEREGFFELAGEGTLFLDEIGEMPLALQSKLLRVIEQREFVRVGGSTPIPLEARIIASTNRSLTELLEEKKFRADLFFRVAVFEIHLPPLRERRPDIPLLVDYFVDKFNKELNRRCLGVDRAAIGGLLAHSWPGNVRELRNVIERAAILCHADYITPEELPPQIAGTAEEVHEDTDDLRDAMHAYEREYIRRVLEATGGNKEETARRLGINPSTLYRKISELGIAREQSPDAAP